MDARREARRMVVPFASLATPQTPEYAAMRWGSREMTLDSKWPDGVTPHEFLVFLLVTCMGLGWAAWAQGKGLPLFTALAPLAGVPYFCLAWWKRIFAGARSQAGIFLMVSSVAVVLYALGVFQRHAQGENYFFGALIFLGITAGILMFNLAPVAEQVAVIVYYFLVAGTILEILALRRDARRDDKAATEETAA